MPYANQAIETLLWSSIVDGDTPADQFEHSTGLAEHVDKVFTQFEAMVLESMPDFDPEEDFIGAGCGSAWEQFEHDFVLTVNGHGAGFWDGDWTSGDKLTEICKMLPEIEVYKGDDDMIYKY